MPQIPPSPVISNFWWRDLFECFGSIELHKLIVHIIVFCLDSFPSSNALRSLVLELHLLSYLQSALLINKTYSIVWLHINYLYVCLFYVSMSVVYVHVYMRVCALMHKCAESRGGHWLSCSTPLPYSFEPGARLAGSKLQWSSCLQPPIALGLQWSFWFVSWGFEFRSSGMSSKPSFLLY